MTSAGVHRARREPARGNGEARWHRRRGAVGGAEGACIGAVSRQPLAEFMRRYAPKGLSAQGGQGGLPPPEKLPVSAHSYGAQFIEISVHRVPLGTKGLGEIGIVGVSASDRQRHVQHDRRARGTGDAR